MQELLVADSFRVRVRGGRAEVRGLDRHLARFGRSVEECGVDRFVLDAFVDRALPAIAAFGEGFPRLELWRDAGADDGGDELRFDLALRPLPELRDSIELRTARLELSHPERKGPNIARLGELNRALGAEALLVDDEGHAVEGATTSLVWWEGSRLCAVASTARVPSVTEALLEPVAALDAAPGRLSRCETWAVNALHGIRSVGSIDGETLPAPDPDRLRCFRAALDATWQAV